MRERPSRQARDELTMNVVDWLVGWLVKKVPGKFAMNKWRNFFEFHLDLRTFCAAFAALRLLLPSVFILSHYYWVKAELSLGLARNGKGGADGFWPELEYPIVDGVENISWLEKCRDFSLINFNSATSWSQSIDLKKSLRTINWLRVSITCSSVPVSNPFIVLIC